MFIRTHKKLVTVLTLIAWMFQVSVTLASNHEVHPSEQVGIQTIEHLQAQNNTSNDSHETNACHPNSNQNCENGFCSGCLFFIPLSMNSHVINSASRNIENYTTTSLHSYHSVLYRPPQIL